MPLLRKIRLLKRHKKHRWHRSQALNSKGNSAIPSLVAPTVSKPFGPMPMRASKSQASVSCILCRISSTRLRWASSIAIKIHLFLLQTPTPRLCHLAWSLVSRRPLRTQERHNSNRITSVSRALWGAIAKMKNQSSWTRVIKICCSNNRMMMVVDMSIQETSLLAIRVQPEGKETSTNTLCSL